MPNIDVTIKLSQLQEYEKELKTAKARNRFLEISYHAEQTTKLRLEASQKASTEAFQKYITDLKTSLAVEVSNVCDLDQEKQDLIEILAERNDVIACLKSDKSRLEKQLAATVARDTSFTLSGNYQVTKISKGKSLSNQAEEENLHNRDKNYYQGSSNDFYEGDM